MLDGLLGKIGNAIGDAIIPSLVTDYLRRYSGPGCCDLKTAIFRNIDIFELWIQYGESEGIIGVEQAIRMAKMAPNGRRLLTPENVRKWLTQERMFDIIKTIDEMPGGQKWFCWTIENFRKGLWEDDGF